MCAVKIITDSSSYLPTRYIEEYGIHIIPLTMSWEGQIYRDGIDIQASEFYTRLAASTSLPTTSQVPTPAFEQAYEQFLAEGYDLLVMTVSGGISGTMQSALQARENFPGKPIEVVDTKLVSMALGFQLLAAARAAAGGAGLAECKATAEDAYPKIGVYFTVDTLKYLAAGGRINSARRLLGTALNVKPLLEIRDGKIELVESVISRRKAVERMVQLTVRSIDGRTPVRISVFHALVPDVAEELLARLEKDLNPVESILTEVSPTIGAHTGPGTLSIAFMAG